MVESNLAALKPYVGYQTPTNAKLPINVHMHTVEKMALQNMLSACHCGELCYHGSQEIHDTIPNHDMHDHVGAYMLICIYAQGQSKYISVFSSTLFLHHIPSIVHTLCQFFSKFFLFLLLFYSSQKPVISTRHSYLLPFRCLHSWVVQNQIV